jgi:cytochrome c oxidase assembly protein subunit 15
LHFWALLTVCAAFPLLLLGAEVTSKSVGMVDPSGFRAPWFLLQEVLHNGLWTLIRERGLGYFIEHTHRLVGFVVGSCVIVLALGLWLRESRRWVRWLGLGALAAVSAQGVLGIFRVNLNALMGGNLALVHGCFAHLVFALLVSLALFTSRSWQAVPGTASPRETARLRHGSLLTAALVYVQMVLGAVVRHNKDLVLGPRIHLLAAFAVVAAVAWLVREVLDNPQRSRQEVASVLVLAGLVVLQLALGVEAWWSRFGARPRTDWDQMPELVRSGHYVVGALVFAAAVVVALQANRRPAWAARPAVAGAGRLEGVA